MRWKKVRGKSVNEQRLKHSLQIKYYVDNKNGDMKSLLYFSE